METTLIYFSISDLKVTTARNILAQAGIESFTIHKEDSVFSGIFGGKIEVYVRKVDQEKADKVLRENEMFD